MLSADTQFHWSNQNVNTDGSKYDWLTAIICLHLEFWIKNIDGFSTFSDALKNIVNR